LAQLLSSFAAIFGVAGIMPGLTRRDRPGVEVR
jgi:hypothetical protein